MPVLLVYGDSDPVGELQRNSMVGAIFTDEPREVQEES